MFTDDELYAAALDAERELLEMFDVDGTYRCVGDYCLEVRVSGGKLEIDSTYADEEKNDIVLYSTAKPEEMVFPADWISDPEDPWTFEQVVEELLSRVDRREVIEKMRDRLELYDASRLESSIPNWDFDR